MKIDYASNKLRKQLSNATEIKKAFGVNAKKVAQRLEDIEASPNLAVLIQIPSANCHALIGNRKGEWTVDISPNHRMIFTINQEPVPLKLDMGVDLIKVTDIRILKTEDYH